MKRLQKLIALLLIFAMCSVMLMACGGGGGDDPDGPVSTTNPSDEKIDTSKTQLYVFNFYGGYGSDWLVAAKTRYEELHKDDVYEEGKKGIQIYINNQKTGLDSLMSSIPDNRDEIYFTEYATYYTLLSEGVLGDITDAVTADLGAYGDAAGTTIESKLTPEQKAYFGISTEGGTKYYGLPHYSGYSGLIYNIDLFEKNGYYFRADVSDVEIVPDDYFIQPGSSEKRSAGPDGEFDTPDDGLPTTYEEFFLLCRYISNDGNTPIVWTGHNYRDYLNNLLQALVANQEGLDNMMLNYNFSGTASDLGTVKDGKFVLDSSATTITANNAYELKRQAGKFYALEFLNTLATKEEYRFSQSFNSAYSHMNAQEDFLYAGNDGGATKPIAMLCDGIWWESEATPTFNDMVAGMGSSFSKQSRNFGYMPLPKATKEAAANGKNTLFDHIYSICFMKSNIEDWKKPIALDFIKFVHTDQSLVEYTQITNTPKAFNYTMTTEQLAKLSPYGRSLLELKQRSDVVYPYASHSIYKNKQGQFVNSAQNYSTVNRTEYQWAAEAMHDGNISAADYFSGMYAYYKNYWSTLMN